MIGWKNIREIKMKTELSNFFKKIILLSVLIIPNIVKADFFEDITAKISAIDKAPPIWDGSPLL